MVPVKAAIVVGKKSQSPADDDKNHHRRSYRDSPTGTTSGVSGGLGSGSHSIFASHLIRQHSIGRLSKK